MEIAVNAATTTLPGYFPTADMQAADFGAAAEDLAAPTGRAPETILVVDDEAAIRHIMSQFLRDAGYAVLAAGSGEEALQIFQTHRDSLSLIVLDMIMPNESGRSVAARLRKLKPELPLLFCTGYDPVTTGHPHSLLADIPTVRKPIELPHFLWVVRNTLRRCHGNTDLEFTRSLSAGRASA